MTILSSKIKSQNFKNIKITKKRQKFIILKKKIPSKYKKRKTINLWQMPTIPDGRPTKYGWIVRYPKNLVLEKGTDIGAFCYIQAEEGVKISESAQLGSHCSVYSVSTIDGRRGKVIIGRNARIGSHSVIMPGVTIGANAVVGAMSFVNRDLPANIIAFGCPVKIFKKRS